MEENKESQLYVHFEGMAITLAAKFWQQYKSSVSTFMDYGDLLQSAKMYLWQTVTKVDTNKYNKDNIKGYIWISISCLLHNEMVRKNLPPAGVNTYLFDDIGMLPEFIVDKNNLDPSFEAFLNEQIKKISCLDEKMLFSVVKELQIPEELARNLVKRLLKHRKTEVIRGKDKRIS